MFARKFPVKRLSLRHLPFFCPISSFAQVRFQRAAEGELRSTSVGNGRDPLGDREEQSDEPLSFDQIPGPHGRYATALEFYRQSDGFAKFYKVPEKLFKVYGPIFKQYVTDKTPVVHVMEPVDFQTVYRAEGKYPNRPPLDFFIEYRKRNAQPIDLSNLNGEEWKRARQAVSPKIMRPKILEENIDNFNGVAEDAIKQLAKIIRYSGHDGEVPDLSGELKKWSTESIGTLVLDARLGLYNDPPSVEGVRLIQGVHEVFECMHILLFGFVEKNLLPYLDTPSFKKFCKALDSTEEVLRMFIDKKMKEFEEMAKQDDLQENQTVPFLTYLLAKKELTLEEVYRHTQTLLGGGVDTTSYSTLWILYHLARNPTVQETLHQELYSILGKDGSMTSGSLAKLSYLKACVKESARITPVAIANRRILEKDVVLSGFLIPAKTIIEIDFYSTGISEKHFKDALEYKPERWLRENKNEIHPFSILPFGHGPRMCIGSRIAELEMYILVAKIIQRFRLEYHHEPLEMIQKLFSVPEKPVRIKFVERF